MRSVVVSRSPREIQTVNNSQRNEFQKSPTPSPKTETPPKFGGVNHTKRKKAYLTFPQVMITIQASSHFSLSSPPRIKYSPFLRAANEHGKVLTSFSAPPALMV